MVTSGQLIVQVGAVALVALIAFVVLVRPQLRRMAAHRMFLTSLKIGDSIVTQGGLIGHIEAMYPTGEVNLAVGASVSVKVTRNCIERRYLGSLEI